MDENRAQSIVVDTRIYTKLIEIVRSLKLTRSLELEEVFKKTFKSMLKALNESQHIEIALS